MVKSVKDDKWQIRERRKSEDEKANLSELKEQCEFRVHFVLLMFLFVQKWVSCVLLIKMLCIFLKSASQKICRHRENSYLKIFIFPNFCWRLFLSNSWHLYQQFGSVYIMHKFRQRSSYQQKLQRKLLSTGAANKNIWGRKSDCCKTKISKSYLREIRHSKDHVKILWLHLTNAIHWHNVLS